MFGLGGQELWIVLIIVLVLFGGAKIPQMMRGLGEGMREFRRASDDTETKPTTSEASKVDNTTRT